MSITASMVAELREKTGAGMMDCKKALTEAGGNMEEAVDLLRKKGLSAAAKKSGRVAAEGLVASAGEGSVGALVEINAETDFVAKNEAFQDFVGAVAQIVLEENPHDVDSLNVLPFPGTDRSVAEELTHQIATIGENMNIRRFVRFEAKPGTVVAYIHGGGKIGALVELQTEKAGNESVETLARQLAMHVAAASPQYLSRDEVPAEVVAREKDIMATKAKESGKPENIIPKIIEGQIGKFFSEICLLEQSYVIDPDQKVEKVVAALAKEIGTDLKLTRFARYQLGEGLEKKEDDFAAEVAALSK